MPPDAPRPGRSTIAGSSLLVAWLVPAAALAQGTLTEAAFIERAASTGLDARVADAELAAARAEGVGRGLRPNPSLAWERQPNPTDDRVVGGQHVVVASLPLVVSGRLALQREAAGLSVLAAARHHDHLVATLRRKAARAFAQVLAAEARRVELADSVRRLRDLAAVIETRERAGAAAGYDRVRADVEAARTADELAGEEVALREARTVAAILLGPDVDELPPLAGDLGVAEPSDLAALVALAGQRRADLRALEIEARAGDTAARAAGRAGVPDPRLVAGAMWLEGAQAGHGVGPVVGVEVPLPLFARGQGDAARGRAQRALADLRRVRTLRAVRLELAALHAGLRARLVRLDTCQRSLVARAEELREIASAGYRGGSADMVALMDAERVAREARLQAVDLRLGAKLAAINLRFVAGEWDQQPGRDR